MVTLDRQEIIATNKSLRLIKNVCAFNNYRCLV